MELWRPDWFKMGIVEDDMRANEIVAVTRGTLRIARLLMEEPRDYYHTTAAALREIEHALNLADKK